MSSVITSSNSNSSLINTIEAADSVENPNVYSTPTIYPTSSSTWSRCEKINGQSKPGTQMNFNLNKYGIIEQVLLCYTKNSATDAGALPAGDVFNVIEKIELLSGSRPISILTSTDLMAQFSDLTTSEQQVVKRTAMDVRAATTGVTAFNYTVPLTFGFMQSVQTQLNSSFLEPSSIRVTWSSYGGNWTAGSSDGVTDVISDTFLNVRYKSYPEAATAQILASNYNKPELVQVSTRFYDESAKTETIGAQAVTNKKMHVELRNTDCVQDIYVMVRALTAATGQGDTARSAFLGPPLKIKEIKFTASGQDIFTLQEQTLEYMRLQSNGWSTAPNEASDDVVGLRNIMKIQVGMYDQKNEKITNTMSLRELNASKIEITFDAEAATLYQMDVVEDTTAIYSTSSAVGRLSLALSN